MVAVPSLDDVARDPGLVTGLPPPVLAALAARCSAAHAIIATEQANQLLTSVGYPGPQPVASDKMLTVEEASTRLRRSRRWLYRNADRLPFVRRVSKKSLLVSESGLNAYLAVKPSLRHITGYGKRATGEDNGEDAREHRGARQDPRGKGKNLPAGPTHNGARSFPQDPS